jgi:mannose-6-phosphate isomerase-like protein (cupin superfamily)
VADNVYIVRKGVGELIVESETYVIRKDHIVFIPSGITHSLRRISEPFEIYAPAGD